MNTISTPLEVLRVDEQLSKVDWPDLIPCDDIDLTSSDCLVVCAGFEDRAMTVIRKACSAPQDFQLRLVRYSPEYLQNQEKEIKDLCENSGISVEVTDYNRENPAGIGDKISETLADFKRIFLDISAMSRLLIVQLIVALASNRNNADLCILYTEAESYLPLREELNQIADNSEKYPAFISSGIYEIAATPELSTVAMLGCTTRLISFPSFNPDQLSNLVDELQPTHNDIISGLPPYSNLEWRKDKILELNKKTISLLQGLDEHTTNTRDYRETLKKILELYGKHNVFDRLVIAPTGSKMQAVAIGILRTFLSDLQIVYPTPRTFKPERYTTGERNMYKLEIPWKQIFGQLSQ